MIKKIILIIFSFLILCILYISLFGIETRIFNKIIQEKTKIVNSNLNLDFAKIKIYLFPLSLQMKVELINPKIKYQNDEVDLSKLSTKIDIRSLIKREYLLKHLDVGINRMEIKKVINIIGQIKKEPILLILRQVIDQGEIEGNAKIYFNTEGIIKDNYEIKGSILNLKGNFLNKFYLNKTDATFKIKKNQYEINIRQSNIAEIDFKNTKIKIGKNKNNLEVITELNTASNSIKFLEILEKFNFLYKRKFFKINDLSFNIFSKINFKIINFKKINNLEIESNGVIKSLNIVNSLDKSFKEYSDDLTKNFFFKDNKILFKLNKNDINLELNGLLKLSNEYEKYSSKIYFDKKNKLTNFQTFVDLKKINLKIKKLNYIKKKDKPANLQINGTIGKEKKLVLKFAEYIEGKNKIYVKNLKFNNRYLINNLDEIYVLTKNNKIVNNDFKIKNESKKLLINGKILDGTYFFKNLFSNNKTALSDKFSTKFKINIDELRNENKNELYNLSGIGEIKNGKYYKLTSKANFSDNEFLDFSITPNTAEEKKILFFSDKAEPFIKNLKFINGFKGGKLEYISIVKKDSSISNLKINDFKLQNVPILTKLLSLASLQGIADLLTGEGIRFNEMDMQFNSNKKLITIKELYAIGPSISLLIEGYIEKEKLISLRGTLVPATTLNKVIGSIPLIGNILVGKKTGEGVFGVSFKIKGPPKKLKTTVNPIKTLTPRFITRTLEKIKESN